MRSSTVARGLALAIIAATPTAGFAQAVPGAEIVGHPVQVTTDGVTNTIYFDTATSQRTVTPNNNSLAGSWGAAAGQLCLVLHSVQECWPYTAPFQAGVPVTLTSLTSGKSSTWTAMGVNSAAPAGQPGGERGQ